MAPPARVSATHCTHSATGTAVLSFLGPVVRVDLGVNANTITRCTATGSLVDASGYKFTEKDTKPGKMKVKKASKASTKKKADGTTRSEICFFCLEADYI